MSNPPNNWVAVIVALIGSVGIIVTAVISRESGERAAIEVAIAATTTAEARLATPTIIQAHDPTSEGQQSNTPTSEPTHTPLPTLTNTSIPPTDTPVIPTSTPTDAPILPTPIPPTASMSGVFIRASDVIPQIKGEDGEIQKILTWWREDDYGIKDGTLDPISSSPSEKCFGLVWNTKEYGYHSLIVFQTPKIFTFTDGGWYVKVCMPNTIQISPEDVGSIQTTWLGKRYGIDNQPWKVVVN